MPRLTNDIMNNIQHVQYNVCNFLLDYAYIDRFFQASCSVAQYTRHWSRLLWLLLCFLSEAIVEGFNEGS